MRVMKAGLSDWSMRHLRRCQNNIYSVRLKRLNKESIDQALQEMKSKPKPIKNTARKSFSGSERVIVRSAEDDKAIDELLEDSSDGVESEAGAKPMEVEANNIVTFGNGFATWTDKHDKDVEPEEVKIKEEPDSKKPQIKVPKPLPELQKIYITNIANGQPSISSKPKANIECVDLCSSDED